MMKDFMLDWCAEELEEALLFSLYDGGIMQRNDLGKNWAIDVKVQLDSGSSQEGRTKNKFLFSLGSGGLVPEPSRIHAAFFVHDTTEEMEPRGGDIAVSVTGDAIDFKTELDVAEILLGIVRMVIMDALERFRMVIHTVERGFLSGRAANILSIKMWQKYKIARRANLTDALNLIRLAEEEPNTTMADEDGTKIVAWMSGQVI